MLYAADALPGWRALESSINEGKQGRELSVA
jgi:hypothetical protein